MVITVTPIIGKISHFLITHFPTYAQRVILEMANSTDDYNLKRIGDVKFKALPAKIGKFVLPLILSVFMVAAYVTKFNATYVLQQPGVKIREDNKRDPNVISGHQIPVQNIPECSCSREFLYPPVINGNAEQASKLNSSCSDEGTHYQTGQNVVSFSLYIPTSGSPKLSTEYWEGLQQNLQVMRKFYQGYSLRLYTNLPLTQPHCSLICHSKELFWCNVNSVPSHGNLSEMVFRTWRFLPLGDPSVNIFLSRDLDSLISSREAAVVSDWLSKGDNPISLMRDRRGGHNVPILAGMWQASNTLLGIEKAGIMREKIISLGKLKSEHQYKGSDQSILNKVVFYPQATQIVAYDSQNCVTWANWTDVRPFPTQRQDPRRDFVGNRVDFAGGKGRFYYNKEECPVECRPEYGKDWIYC